MTEAPDGAFTDEDERIVLLIADMAAVAIENARLYEDATEQAQQARAPQHRLVYVLAGGRDAL
ncbi:MAG: hypothetical protein M3Q31_05120 [Actinomycetota bacterium]|nr:hypothetical protein [Actinomycetota bacterium]